MELPVLVEHGALLWKVAAIALVAAGFPVARRWLPWPLALLAPALIVAAGLAITGGVAVAKFDLDDLGIEGSKPVVACKDPRTRHLPLDQTSAIAIAAATPLERTHALDVLHTELQCQYVRTPDAFAARLAIDDLFADRQERRAHDFYDEGRFEQAVAEGESDVRVPSLLRLGRYDEAWQALADGDDVRPHTRLIAAIATNHWSEASEAARELGNHCLALGLSARGGDDGSARLLAAMSSTNDRCYVIASVALPGASIVPPHELSLLALDEALIVLADRRQVTISDYVGFFDVFGSRPSLVTWLVPFAEADQRQRTMYALLVGDPVAAAAEAVLDDEPESCSDDCPTFARGIRLRLGLSFPTDDPRIYLGEHQQWNPLFADADGIHIAQRLRETDGEVDLAWLFSTLPRLTGGRAELAAAIDLERPTWTFRPDSPFAWSRSAALRADLARLLGNRDGALRWYEVAHRHATLLRDRDHLIWLLLAQIG
jgi:hypothetical protein